MTESGAKIHSNMKQLKIKRTRFHLGFTTLQPNKATLKNTKLPKDGTGKWLQYNYEIQLIFRLCKSVQKYAKQGAPVISVNSVSIKSGVFVFCLL